MKKFFAALLCILCLAGCAQQPDIVLEPVVAQREDFVGIYITEWYTSKIGVDNPEYTKMLGEADEEKFVHPGSEAIVELRDDGVVLYGNDDREISEVGTWSYSDGNVTIDTPDISTDMNEGITISCMGMDMTVEYGWSGIPHERTRYGMNKLDTTYIAGEYELKAGMKDGEYYSTQDNSADKADVSLTLADNGSFTYRTDGEELTGTWKEDGRMILLGPNQSITAEWANGRIFVTNGERCDMLIRK